MSDLSDLYQEVILDHNRRPRNFGPLPGADRSARGNNPLCGDRITVHLRMEGDVIRAVSFEGSGCAISKASASLMTLAVEGKSRPEALDLLAAFLRMVTARMEAPPDAARLGRLAAFAGVREFPVRVKCASLPWHTLKAALESPQQEVSTE